MPRRRRFTILTVSETARRISERTGEPCTPDAVRAQERRGQLLAMRTPSGVRLFDQNDVDRFIARRMRKAEAAIATTAGDAA
jgi:hypothetical protein